ncbi:hypothetical protein FHT60_003713 [Novosphingobium sp. BK486]|nr:hypothetical protein [Novosphingobium sp. BK256]MBB3376229.1 hypothetical protein [Novosphingobium sp. BK280]MBB3380643.1 hypothetical protein [Novosphingobium sp. BK258]MBB3422361.1 hypothetical protein [Novosphingobium sp. BK267]MBB3451061.1 hypothetical protein [Novosphingobium sp. BK352]MBB3479569.1 hypothetical protein [Novosphingobium sp. BK369]MBB3502816.1 hypothetical protein [Novosphingobium sp. BK336]MBB3538602.1 hypothetical protein [Novosphingobium sp. BK486]MBB3558064.1 hypo
MSLAQGPPQHTVGSWLDFLKGLIPGNFLGLIASTEIKDGTARTTIGFSVLQLVVIGMALGFAALRSDEAGDVVLRGAGVVLAFVRRLLNWVVRLAPLGRAGLMGKAVVTYGWGIRRFLNHVRPRGFHRIRCYGLLASSTHKDAMGLTRRLSGVAAPIAEPEPDEPPDHRPPCPCCGGHMTIIEAFARWVPTTRTTNASIPGPETRAMIGHGSPFTTVTVMVFWLMTRRIPIPELFRAQGTLASKTNVARNLIPHQIKLIGPTGALPDRQCLPARTIPKLI